MSKIELTREIFYIGGCPSRPRFLTTEEDNICPDEDSSRPLRFETVNTVPFSANLVVIISCVSGSALFLFCVLLLSREQEIITVWSLWTSSLDRNTPPGVILGGYWKEYGRGIKFCLPVGGQKTVILVKYRRYSGDILAK